ncbi:MAG: glycosyltransferase family 4 protein [Euryarchaeota archaeon]|nr:glycosyltransferase family 4 protein [Euryarchaeota archaeon]
MKILVVQESDWIERNPHQQHHLMDILSAKGHKIRVIDYGIDWRRKERKWHGIYVKKQIFNDYHKINPEAKIQVIRPSIIEIPIIDYLSIPFFHGREIKRQIKEFKPDVIVAFGLLNAYYASKAAKRHNIPFVYYLIDVLYALIPEKPLQTLGKYLKKRTIKNSTKVITINKRLAELAIELGADKDKTSLIDAGIYLDAFDPKINGSNIREEYGIRKNDTVLFYMGWIYHFAGMKEVARDLVKIKEENPQIKLLIVGDGDAYNDLEKIKEDYKLDGQLILTGKQPYEKIPEFIAASDICLLPAYPDEEIMQDIVPIKLYEYMAMEKPVITTPLPGIMMEFGEDNGLIYVDKPEDVLEEVIQLIKENKILENGKKARKFVENNDWDKITYRFEKTLEDLI